MLASHFGANVPNVPFLIQIPAKGMKKADEYGPDSWAPLNSTWKVQISLLAPGFDHLGSEPADGLFLSLYLFLFLLPLSPLSL